ncbi:MAG: sigma-54-dependent Fis family transcriptional regulator [Spirochaetaceae bacterium]|nr:sigma-54-dependent Fis family transcriptional regulator [Spirochaetaceae bacterium]
MDTILHVGSDAAEARTLASVLTGEYRVVSCGPETAAALAALRRESPAAVILDPGGPGGFELLEALARGRGFPPVIAMSDFPGPRSVVRAIRGGAADCLPRPCPPAELLAALSAALEPGLKSLPPFVGNSEALRNSCALIERFARHEYPVLVLGESGTGKELAARALHDRSPRRGGPFIAKNCAAIPEELIESELFGSDRGAFTGAVERPGAFELAAGGTLFLDEIGEAGASVQAKLLRALESGEFWRLGGRSPRTADIRLVTATSRDLRADSASGGFRPDLLYRIEILRVELPPLRERREDIALLAETFALSASGGQKRFSPAALDLLGAQSWPGNIRQLKNVVFRAVVLAEDREEIGVEHVCF